jgi:hypothetical protein
MKTRGLVLAAVAAAAAVTPAHAYDPATTHAGMTERAALASSLHRVLARRMGRPLGLLEPLQIYSRTLDPPVRKALWARLETLDPAGGYRPGVDGVATALSWVVAGAVLAETPPERGRHHFLDPRKRVGLDDAPGLTGFGHAVRLAMDDGATLREMATGQAFDLTGKPSLEWIASPLNDQGLPALLDQWERAVVAGDPAERESALVRALMALGGLAAVLQDAGEPAHVRNDFREAFLRRQGRSSWDRASSYERFVASAYGRAGIPAVTAPVRRPTLEAYFTAGDGKGLADRTQRRFFSEGTVPGEVLLDARTGPDDVVRSARESLPLPSPTITGVVLRPDEKVHYLKIDGRRALAYVRDTDRVKFFLDRSVHADTAKVLIPEITAYAAGLLDHLLRAGVQVAVSGGNASLTLEGVAGSLSEATLRLYGEDDRGARRELPGAGGAIKPGEAISVSLPKGIRRVAAVVRGKDSSGPFVATGEANIE